MILRCLPLKSPAGPLLIFFLFVSCAGFAQRRRGEDTSHYRTVPVPAHLLPIERGYGSSAVGGIYFYGGKRLSSPYSLEVPFYELNDPTVNHHFQTFRTMTTLSRVTALVPLAYVLLRNSGSNGTYWAIYGGSVGASLALSLIGNGQVNKAVGRYNELLTQPRLGLSATPVPLTGRVAVGAGITWGF